MHRLVTCQKNLQNIWKHNDKFDIDVSNLINIILRVSSTHDIQLRIMDIWRGKKGEWRMKNDMINIYKWLSKFINIHLTTQEAQELGTRLIYIKNACTLNNFHKRPLIIKHQQAYILFHEIIFQEVYGWVGQETSQEYFSFHQVGSVFFFLMQTYTATFSSNQKNCAR